MYIYKQPFEKMLRFFGYHGVYVSTSVTKFVNDSEFRISLLATFWKSEYKIDFHINCINVEITEDILRGFIEIFMFTGSEQVKNISAEDDIEGMLYKYLFEKESFEKIRYKGKILRSLSIIKNGIEYDAWIRMQTNETSVVNIEDIDEIMEFNKNEMEQLLKDRGVGECEVEVFPDCETVRIKLRNKQKQHCLEIHTFYDRDFYVWSSQAAKIVYYYWELLVGENLYLSSFVDCLRKDDFYEVDSSRDIAGSAVIFAYRLGDKYRIKIDVEDVKIPFDDMDGHEFERFCADVLAKNSFEKIRVTQGSGDQGVDIIAYKDDVKYGIQCKCYSSDIGNRAVQEVFAGKTYYQCHVGVVLTNRYFTKAAIELAKRNGVVLWDRDRLMKMVDRYNLEM